MKTIFTEGPKISAHPALSSTTNYYTVRVKFRMTLQYCQIPHFACCFTNKALLI